MRFELWMKIRGANVAFPVKFLRCGSRDLCSTVAEREARKVREEKAMGYHSNDVELHVVPPNTYTGFAQPSCGANTLYVKA